MKRSSVVAAVLLLTLSVARNAAASWPAWLDHAPLNTDSSLLGFSSAIGLAKAYRYLAYLSNFAGLAGLIYAFARQEAAFSNIIYVFVGITLGGLILSFFLGKVFHAFTLVPIVILAAWLLAQFCCLSPRKALTVSLTFHAYQIAYILVYKAIETKYK
jgi:hypothetical protein